MGEWVKPKREVATANRDEAQDERCAEQRDAITDADPASRSRCSINRQCD